MSFGISGQIDRNTMVGGDVVVAWIDHETLNGFAYDYYLDSKSQCAGSRGSCPDVKLRVRIAVHCIFYSHIIYFAGIKNVFIIHFTSTRV
jgi:serine protease inhibitor ecotin